MQSKKMTKDNLFTHAEHQVIFRRREDLKTKKNRFYNDEMITGTS